MHVLIYNIALESAWTAVLVRESNVQLLMYSLDSKSILLRIFRSQNGSVETLNFYTIDYLTDYFIDCIIIKK